MTKAELARAVYDRHGGISNQEARRIVDLIIDIIRRQLLKGDEVHIVGFGTLEVIKRSERRGRNPVTGETIQLPERRALVFRPSRAVRAFNFEGDDEMGLNAPGTDLSNDDSDSDDAR
ncbi:MAG TPA: HU family DNA-binding protein [Blastocatellia bacterium]|nr:HU family DNA-binding protein [Blastocatellia bacterium]